MANHSKQNMAESDDPRKRKIKDRVRILKQSLEGWREVLLPMNSLLMWERKYDPGVLVGAATIIFAIFWYFDPSVLTTFAILCIVACIADYTVPTFSASFSNPDKWMGVNERKYEDICKGIAQTWEHIECFHTTMSHLKDNKPKLYFVTVLVILLFFAWLGNVMDNLLLTFISSCFVVLLPGLKHHGIFKQYLSRLLFTAAEAGGIQKHKTN